MREIKVNTDEQVYVYITSAEQVAGRRRVKLPFNPIVDSGRVKYITFYPGVTFNGGIIGYKQMYSPTRLENGTLYNLPNVALYHAYMLTIAKKGGDYIFFDMPLAYFIPDWGGNYRIPCDYDIDFDRSFIRLFANATGALPTIIPLFFTMWPQEGDGYNYSSRHRDKK